MDICSHVAPNGKKSILYQLLEDAYGEKTAHDAWETVRTQQFLNKHGNWMKSYSMKQIASMNAKELYKKIAQLDSPLDARGLAQEYLAGGGTISPETLFNEVLTKRDSRLVPDKAQTKKEVSARDYVKKGSASISEIAHTLWESNPEELRFAVDEQDIRNELIDLVNTHNTRYEVATEYAKGRDVQLSEAKQVPLDENGEPQAGWVITTLDLKPIEKKEDPLTPGEVKPSVISIDLESGLTKNRLNETQMLGRIQTLYTEALANPDQLYQVTYEHISDKARLGKTQYTSRELAVLFDMLPIPINISFTPGMQKLIDNGPRRIAEQFKDDMPVEFISRNEDKITQTAANLLIPKVNKNGRPDGFFTPAQHKEIVDSITSITERIYRSDPGMKANALIQAIGFFKSKEQQLIAQNKLDQAAIFTSVYNNRVTIADAVLQQLESLGLHATDATKRRVLGAVDAARPLTQQEKEDFQAANPELDPDQLDPYTGEFMESVGRIARDWSDNTFELDPKDTASARIKMFIGTLYEMDRGIYTVDPNGQEINEVEDIATWTRPQQLAFARSISRKPFWFKDQKASENLQAWLSETYPRFSIENFMGTGRTADFDTVFKELLGTLGNQLQGMSFEQAMAILDDHYNPTIQQVAEDLRKANESMQNEFMTVMSKQYQPFVMALFNTVRDAQGQEFYVLNPIKSNRYGQRETLIEHWKQQQKLMDITVVNEAGDRVLDVKRIRERWLPILDEAREINDWSLPENKEFFIETLGDVLRVSGIGVTDEMTEDLYKNPGKWTNSDSVTGLFVINKKGQPEGLFSIFIMKSAGQLLDTDTMDLRGATRLSEMNNPLYTEPSLMNGLAKLVSKYTPVLYSSNHRNSEGKSVYDWGLNTKLSHQLRKLTQDFETFIDEANQVDIARNNWLINTLIENPKQLKEIELSYMDGLKPTWGNRGTTRQSMSDREQLLMSVALFQNRGNSHNKMTRVNYMSLTHSDKTMTPIFRNMPRLDIGKFRFIPNTIIGRSDAALFNVFRAEYNRIVNQADTVFNSKQYDAGKHLFYFIPDFNYDSMKDMVAEGVLSKEEFQIIWPAGERKLTNIIDSERELVVINKILTRFMNSLVMNTLNKWTENGIISEDELLFDRDYINKIASQNSIKTVSRQNRQVTESPVMFVDENNQEVPRAKYNQIIAGTAAKDYAVNTFLFNTAMSQLFYGDPAETFKKSKKGSKDIDHVKSTLIEYSKRLAKDIAPRSDLYWPEGKQTYNTITIADVKTRETYLKDIKGLKEAYGDSTIDATDAQELTTVQEKLDVLMAAGQIPSDLYEEMSTIIANPDENGYYEFKKPEHLNLVLQPDKPVYAGTRAPDRGAALTDYVKSSSYALYPPLTRGREIDGLRKMMESKGIARANFESARKMGGPTVPLEVMTPDGKFVNPSDESINNAIRVMDRSGFGIQQEVPYEEEKELIKTVTQMNENIIEGIRGMQDFYVAGLGDISGIKLKQLKEEVRKEMLIYNVREFSKKLNIDQSGVVDTEKIMDLLASEAHKKGYTINELQGVLIRDADGTPVISTMFNTAADRFESLLMSMVNKVAEVKMPGKSYVQASGIGYRLSDGADLSQVIWVGDYDGKPLKGLRIEDGVVKPGQVIMPFNFFDAAGNKLKVEDFLITVGNKKILDPERVPLELLQLVAARIPNQKHSSIHPIEIVGFTPENMGDVIFIPAVLVKQMGADFDVDKLYTYKRPYTYDPVTAAFSAIAVQDTGEKTLEQMQRRYFDLHWAVLTHKEMLPKILKPLELDDLKEESELLSPESTGYYNYFDTMSQLEDFQRGKDAKRLVGASSWAGKFNARIQDKRLQISKQILQKNDEGKEVLVTVADEIEVVDEHVFVPRKLTMLSGMGKSKYGKDKAFQSDLQARTKAENQVLVQSEALDNNKTRTLDPLNLTPDTYMAVQALLQLEDSEGWAVNSKYWTRLLTQPIMWEYTKEMKQGNDSLSDKFDPNLHTNVVGGLIRKWHGSIKPMETWSEKELDALEVKVSEVRFSPELLLKMRKMDGEDLVVHQLAALRFYSKLYGIGRRMLELESQFNQDVSGAGPNLFTAITKDEALDRLEQVPIMRAIDLYQNEEKELTEVGVTFDVTTQTAIDIVGQILPYQALAPLFNKLTAFTGKPTITVDTQRDMLRAFRSFVYTGHNLWWNDSQKERVRLLYGESLAKRIVDAQITWGKDNPMLLRLKPRIGANEADPDYVEYIASTKTSAIDKQNMSNGWLHMLMSSDEGQRKLAEDMVRYAYLTGGVQDANSFVEFIPIPYLAGTEFGNMLKGMERTLKEEGEYENDGFLIQFIQHNPQLATQLVPTQFKNLEKGREYPESFAIPSRGNPAFQQYANLAVGDKMLPFVSYRSKADGKWILYMANQVGKTTYYTRVDTLGNSNSDEYNGLIAQGQRSIFSVNRSLAERVPGISVEGITDIQNMKNNMFARGDYNQNVSHFHQIGIRQGGTYELTNALMSIRNNREIPQYLRVVSELLLVSRETAAGAEAKRLTTALGIPFQILWDENIDGAGEANFKNQIKLNSTHVKSTTEAAEVFLHELQHNRLQWLVLATGYDNRIAATEKGLQFIKDFKDKYPKVYESVKALDKIRFEALNKFMTERTAQEFQEIQADVDQGKLTSDEHRIYYGLSSLQEFMAHVPTDTAVAFYLNQIQSKEGRSLLTQIWDLFADMLQAVGEALGFKVNDKALLHDALLHVMKLTAFDTQENTDITKVLMDSPSTIKVPTEMEAGELKALFENTYDRPTTATKYIDGWELTVNQHKRSQKHAVQGQRGRILTELYNQSNAISDALSRTHDLKGRTALRSRYREVRENIKQVHQENDIGIIAKVGTQQLKWVDEVLRSPQPSSIDVSLAIQTANIWSSLVDILYGNLKQVEIGEEFAELQTSAQAKRIELINTKAWDSLVDTYKDFVKLTPLDLTTKLEDIDSISANALSISRAKAQLVQAIAADGQRAANNRDEHIYRNHKRIQSLEKKLKAAGLNSNNMLRMNEDGTSMGLVNRLSDAWGKRVRDDRNKLDASIAAIEKSSALSDVQRRERSLEAWNNYWNGIKNIATFVDARIFFDVKAGSRNKGPEVDAAFDKLAEEVGDRNYAEELVQDAQAKYQDYLSEREAMNEYLDSVMELTEEEKEGKTQEEQEELLDEAKEDAMKAWLKYNSPIDMLNSLDSKKNVEYNSAADEWIVLAPKKEFTDFYDEQYLKIAGDATKLAAYNEYKSILKEMTSYLPVEVQREMPDDFFPIVPKDSASWLKNTMDKIRNWNTELLNALTATDAEEASRLRPDKIPVMYTHPTAVTKEMENRSTDLGRTLELYSMMALQHKYMGSVLDTINIAESVLKEVNRKRMEGKAEGKPLRHLMDAVKYFKDALIFKKPKELQGKVDSTIYSLNPATQHKITEDIRKLTQEKEELENQVSEKMIEGDFDTETEDKRIEAIDKELTKYQIMARNIYGSKFADGLISINQMKAIGYNPFSAVSNYTFAEISMGIHARGRIDYDPKTLRQAMGIMTHAMSRYWSFGSVTDDIANKIHGLMARVGIMSDVVDTDYGQGIQKRKTRTGKILDPFNWQRSGDYFTKGKLMVAMMLHEKIEVTENGEKKTIPLWEAFNAEGEWNTEKYGVEPAWDIREGDGILFQKFRDRARKVSTMVFGNQDKNSPVMARKSWLWRLAGQFRLSWFPEGIATRFKPSYFDAQLGRETKGRWRSYSDIGFLTSSMIVCKQLASVLPGVKVDAFEGARDKEGKLVSESPVDMENMRKNFAGLAWTAGFTAMILILRGLGDDKEKKNNKRQLLVNMLIRNQQDLMLYSSPAVFNTISGNFLPASQVLVDYWNAVTATGKYLFKSEKEKKDFETWIKKITRAGLPHPSATLYNKFETMMTRDLDKIQR